ncbi:MAG: hypothetical protein HYV07_32085 [Deltaproteobacteria bacterium]|nr:hypothetical protein [Deltaproteobacteria bacterium]
MNRSRQFRGDPIVNLLDRFFDWVLARPDAAKTDLDRACADAIRVLARYPSFERTEVVGRTYSACGLREGMSLRVELDARLDMTRATLDARGRIPPNLSLLRSRRTAEERIEIGDHFFDNRYSIYGDRVEILALLDAELRERILGLPELEVDRGMIALRLGEARPDAVSLLALSESLVDVKSAIEKRVAQPAEARLLARCWREAGSRSRIAAVEALLRSFPGSQRGGEARQVLVEVVASDPVEENRGTALEILVESAPDSPEAVLGLERAAKDASARIRYFAAMRLGAKGLPVLRGLAESRFVPEPMRAAAIRRLVGDYGFEAALPSLEVCAREAGGPLRTYALDRIISTGGDELGGRLLTIARNVDLDGASAILTRIWDLPFKGHEDVLLELLKLEDPTLRGKVVRALGHRGTIRSVPALVPISRALFSDSMLKELARVAIRQIQSRVGAGEAGALSVAELGPTGGLSEAAEELGALSIPRPGQAVTELSEAPTLADLGLHDEARSSIDGEPSPRFPESEVTTEPLA